MEGVDITMMASTSVCQIIKKKIMKTKLITFLALTTLVTLSFTFVSVKTSTKEETTPIPTVHSEPIGGFALDDQL